MGGDVKAPLGTSSSATGRPTRSGLAHDELRTLRHLMAVATTDNERRRVLERAFILYCRDDQSNLSLFRRYLEDARRLMLTPEERSEYEAEISRWPESLGCLIQSLQMRGEMGPMEAVEMMGWAPHRSDGHIAVRSCRSCGAELLLVLRRRRG